MRLGLKYAFRLGLGELHSFFFRCYRTTATSSDSLADDLSTLNTCPYSDISLEHSARRIHYARFDGLVSLGLFECHGNLHLYRGILA